MPLRSQSPVPPAAAEHVAPAFSDGPRALWEAGTDTCAANGMPLRRQSPVPPAAASAADTTQRVVPPGLRRFLPAILAAGLA